MSSPTSPDKDAYLLGLFRGLVRYTINKEISISPLKESELELVIEKWNQNLINKDLDKFASANALYKNFRRDNVSDKILDRISKACGLEQYGYRDWSAFVSNEKKLDGNNGKDIPTKVSNRIMQILKIKNTDTDQPINSDAKLLELITNNQYQFYYLYFYEGRDGYIKPAIICFKKDDDMKDWGDGLIHYLEKDESGKNYIHSTTFTLKRLLPEEGKLEKPRFIYYQAISDKTTPENYQHLVNLFTINVSEEPVEKRFLFFLGSSTVTKVKHGRTFTSINIGIVKKINQNKFIDEIREIDPWIKNTLTGKRLNFGELESMVFKNLEEFEKEKVSYNSQFACIEILYGDYLGVYPRRDFKNSNKSNKGGIAFIIMQVFADGTAKMTTRNNQHIIKHTGIFSFPFDHYDAIKGEFGRHNKKHYRISLYLKNENNKLLGVISGLMVKNKDPYVSPIVFYPILKGPDHKLAGHEELIKTYQPERLDRNDIEKHVAKISKTLNGTDAEKDWLTTIKDDLKLAQEYYFHNVEDCFDY